MNRSFFRHHFFVILLMILSALSLSVHAQNLEQIRKNLKERLPSMPPIDEIQKTPIAGLFEIRIDDNLYYVDAKGDYLIQGELIDTKRSLSLTEERTNRLRSIDFQTLPFDDAFTIVRGTGERKVAIFEDPNCGYCKRFEADLAKVDNVTVYLFLVPILGSKSLTDSGNLWCSPDKAAAWQDWMLRNQPAPEKDASCDTSALTRNLAFARQQKITGTPTLIFSDGSRVVGAIKKAQIEDYLNKSNKNLKK